MRRDNQDGSRARRGRRRWRLRSCRPAVLLGELRKRNRRRILLDPASKLLDARIVWHGTVPSAIASYSSSSGPVDRRRYLVADLSHLSDFVSHRQHHDVSCPACKCVRTGRTSCCRLAVAPVPAVADDPVAGPAVDCAALKNTACPGNRRGRREHESRRRRRCRHRPRRSALADVGRAACVSVTVSSPNTCQPRVPMRRS